MENHLQVFFHEEFGEIRVLLINGLPWFVAVDICRVLKVGNVSQALSRLDDDEKMTITLNDSHSGKRGGAQKISLVSEPGFYGLVLSSRSKDPRVTFFKRWIKHEVIPAIMRTGSYTMPTANPQDDPRWIETREHGKATRREETDVIKIFNEYRKAQGSKRPDAAIYAKLSNLANNAAGVKKGGRNSASVHQLNVIDLAEGMIRDELTKGINDAGEYSKILDSVDTRISTFIEIIDCNHKLLN